MGTIWVAVPFERKLAEWVRESGVLVPLDTPDGRAPSLPELELALSALPTLVVAERELEGEEWRFDIETVADRAGPWTVLRAKREAPGELSLGFFKGWDEAVLEVAQAISLITGPLVVVADCEGAPIVVTASRVYASHAVVEEEAP